MADKLKVDPEFAALCPPLAPEEMNLLEHNIVKDGCLEPLAVWVNGSTTLLDGHNRHRICTQLGLEFTTKTIEIKDRNEAINWIINKQLGRRNLPDEQKAYLRGKRNLAEKQVVTSPDGCKGRIDDQSGRQLTKTTRQRLAEEYGVGEATIGRDSAFAKAVDRLAPEDRAIVLSGQSGLSMNEVRAGKKPGDVTPSLRTAKRQQRAREKISTKADAAAAIADHGLDDVKAAPEQKRLVEFCVAITRLAAGVAGIVSEEKSILAAKQREHWTAHNKTRVRAQLAALKREISRIEKFLE